MLIDADGDKIHDKKGKMIDMDIFPFPLLAFKKFLSMSNFANKNTEHPCSIWELPMLKKKKKSLGIYTTFQFNWVSHYFTQ